MNEEVKYTHYLTSEEKLESWGYGDWVEEADEALFTYKGIKCCVMRMAVWEGSPRQLSLGQLNGYVKIPDDHPLFGKDIYEEEVEIEVHGGLTYGGDLKDNGDFWMGFDCAHSGDLVPSLGKRLESKLIGLPAGLPKKYYKKFSSFLNEPIYRNMRFCIEECKKMVDQVLEIGVEKDY